MREISPHITVFIQNILQTVVEWRFATDEYYNPLPLYHEINKFKKGRIIKHNTSFLAHRPGVYKFGFNRAGQLVVAQHLIGQDESLGVNTKLYTYDPMCIKHSTIRHYPNNNFPDQLIAFGQYEKFSDAIAAEVVVGSSHSISATIFHTNDAGIIERVERQATGWNGATTYMPIFDEQGVKEVLVGDTRWWKRAGK